MKLYEDNKVKENEESSPFVLTLKLSCHLLFKVFVCCVPSLCNMASHSLAKWSLVCNFFGSFDFDNSPPSFVSIIQGEVCLPVQFVFSLNKISGPSQKKKRYYGVSCLDFPSLIVRRLQSKWERKMEERTGTNSSLKLQQLQALHRQIFFFFF